MTGTAPSNTCSAPKSCALLGEDPEALAIARRGFAPMAQVNGSVTNLRLRLGDFATAGQPSLAIVDSDSCWIAGYFEETQLAAIHSGDKADYILMGYPGVTLNGHVDSISRGIADQNAEGSGVALASVNPVFTWVRLAQRIPVRIAIEDLPVEMVMAAGMTATVTVGKPMTLADDLEWAFRFWTRGGRF